MQTSIGIKYNENPPNVELVGCITIYFKSPNEIRITNSQIKSPSSMFAGLSFYREAEYLYRFNKDVTVDYILENRLFTITLNGHDFMIYKPANNINIDDIIMKLKVNHRDDIIIPVIDINTQLDNIKHLMSSTDYDKLDDLWDK